MSVAVWRLPGGRARGEKLVTVSNKFNPYLFVYSGAAVFDDEFHIFDAGFIISVERIAILVTNSSVSVALFAS